MGLKRVFKIELETCEACGGEMKVIAHIEDLAVIKRSGILRGLFRNFDQTVSHNARNGTAYCPSPKLALVSPS